MFKQLKWDNKRFYVLKHKDTLIECGGEYVNNKNLFKICKM